MKEYFTFVSVSSRCVLLEDKEGRKTSGAQLYFFQICFLLLLLPPNKMDLDLDLLWRETAKQTQWKCVGLLCP